MILKQSKLEKCIKCDDKTRGFNGLSGIEWINWRQQSLNMQEYILSGIKLCTYNVQVRLEIEQINQTF